MVINITFTIHLVSPFLKLKKPCCSWEFPQILFLVIRTDAAVVRPNKMTHDVSVSPESPLFCFNRVFCFFFVGIQRSFFKAMKVVIVVVVYVAYDNSMSKVWQCLRRQGMWYILIFRQTFSLFFYLSCYTMSNNSNSWHAVYHLGISWELGLAGY